jgi:serine/threonine protein kinase
MAPELFKEETYGVQVDVWAFGLLAHYILFKEHYFLAESESKVKQRVLKDKYELTS